MSRWLRCLICLALICCILVNCSPLRAEATGAGVAAATITGAATVTVSAPIAIGAAVIALGIAAGTNDDFQRLVDTAVSAAGDWVKDSTVELLQTVNSAGEKAYYVAGEMLDDLRLWSAENVIPNVLASYNVSFWYPFANCTYRYESDAPLTKVMVAYESSKGTVTYVSFLVSDRSFSAKVYKDGVYKSKVTASSNGGFYYTVILESPNLEEHGWTNIIGSSYVGSLTPNKYGYFKDCTFPDLSQNIDVSLGHLPSSDTNLTDGTSARAWSEPMTNNGLYVTGGSNDPDPPDENNGKWFWPLALTLTAADLWLMSQADEWSGKTPQEFDDYSKQTEFEILSRPEVEFGQGIEIAPVTSPSPDPGTGTDPDPGTDPTAPGEPNPEPEPDPDPNPDPGTDPNPDPGTDTGGTTGGNSGWVPPSDHSLFALGDLSKFFPFCIPFDLFDFFTLLNADPVAPVFSWEIEDLSGQTYSLTIDLAEWDPVALLFRRLQLFLFICGLAAASRKYIKW